MAGAVVKYKPEKVDKMMCIAQASALQVLFSAIRVSLPIGGLLWLISSNFLGLRGSVWVQSGVFG